MDCSVLRYFPNGVLRGEVDIGPLGFSHGFDAVADGGSSCEGPARSAVTGADLVFLEGQKVGAVDVAPPEGGWVSERGS